LRQTEVRACAGTLTVSKQSTYETLSALWPTMHFSQVAASQKFVSSAMSQKTVSGLQINEMGIRFEQRLLNKL
jgi:hypothetical protein